MNIAVIGTGYVGLVTGACLACDHMVTCIDKDVDKIKDLCNGIMPIYENGLEALVKDCVEVGRLKFSTDFVTGVSAADVVFICVGTPALDSGSSDLRALWSVVTQMRTIPPGAPKVVVVKSTVPVGTNTEIQKEFQRHGLKHEVVSNPEFLREGRAVDDFLSPDRVIIGGSNRCAIQTIRELYMPIPEYKVLRMSLEDAEMVKYASNCMLATKISFINEMANICEILGGNIKQVCRGMGADPRIGTQFLNPGIGYGGSCFPKDVSSLKYQAGCAGYNTKLLMATMDINAQRPRFVFDKLQKGTEGLNGKRIAIWGGAFKPDTDDIREAPSVPLIKLLLQGGAEVSVYDPKAMDNLKEVFGDKVEFCGNAYGASKAAAAVVLVTEWEEFTHLCIQTVKDHMYGSVFMDCRNVMSPGVMRDLGFNYIGIGTG